RGRPIRRASPPARTALRHRPPAPASPGTAPLFPRRVCSSIELLARRVAITPSRDYQSFDARDAALLRERLKLRCCRASGRSRLHRGGAPNSMGRPRRMGRNSPSSSIPTRRSPAMAATYNILIMGASYGSLLASKLLFGCHQVKLVCLPAEADLINTEGFRVRLPVRGRKAPVEIDSRKLPGKVSAGGAADVEPTEYDLICLAMQEPQYRSPGVRQLLDAVGRSKVPCMSIMNMPPLPYLKRIPGLNTDTLKSAYTDASVWDSFDPALLTLC